MSNRQEEQSWEEWRRGNGTVEQRRRRGRTRGKGAVEERRRRIRRNQEKKKTGN